MIRLNRLSAMLFLLSVLAVTGAAQKRLPCQNDIWKQLPKSEWCVRDMDEEGITNKWEKEYYWRSATRAYYVGVGKGKNGIPIFSVNAGNIPKNVWLSIYAENGTADPPARVRTPMYLFRELLTHSGTLPPAVLIRLRQVYMSVSRQWRRQYLSQNTLRARPRSCPHFLCQTGYLYTA